MSLKEIKPPFHLFRECQSFVANLSKEIEWFCHHSCGSKKNTKSWTWIFVKLQVCSLRTWIFFLVLHACELGPLSSSWYFMLVALWRHRLAACWLAEDWAATEIVVLRNTALYTYRRLVTWLYSLSPNLCTLKLWKLKFYNSHAHKTDIKLISTTVFNFYILWYVQKLVYFITKSWGKASTHMSRNKMADIEKYMPWELHKNCLFWLSRSYHSKQTSQFT